MDALLALAGLAIGGLVAAGLAEAAALMWPPAFWPVFATAAGWWAFVAWRQHMARAQAATRRKGDFH